MNKKWIRKSDLKAYPLMFMLALTLLVHSCHLKPKEKEQDYKTLIAKYGTAFNEERKKDSLPILPAHWKVINKQPGFISWGPYKDIYREKGYILKSIYFDSGGTILSEENVWFSGQKHPCGEDHEPDDERIWLSFDFVKNDKGKYPWAADASCSPGFWKKVNRPHHPETHQLIIDSVLSEWGMKRLNW